MLNTCNQELANRDWPRESIDARIVSLESHRVMAKPYHEKSAQFSKDKNYYNSFQYYDVIRIKKVDLNKDVGELSVSPLRKAYAQSLSQDMSVTPLQLLTYTDISSEDGYSKEDLDAFWDSKSDTLLFVSLISVSRSVSLAQAAARIKSTMQGINCRIYYSFDSFDIVIFYRGTTFKSYADKLLTICYSNDDHSVFVDSVTVFGFIHDSSPQHVNYISTEEFGVLIQLCITDYSAVSSFSQQVRLNNSSIQAFSMLGRNDYCIFNPSANLAWLWSIHNKAKQELSDAIVDIHVSILLDPHDDFCGRTADTSCNYTELMTKIIDFCHETRRIFHTACVNADLPRIGPSTKWLSDSLKLVTHLYNNKLSRDIAVCLLPQYLDMMIYLNRHSMYSTGAELRDANERLTNCLTSFFFNINTLLECMNHSDKQFIHTLAYHSISFQMPAKIMAYYTALIRYLIEALHDDENNYYGFTLSPSFADELAVNPITAQHQIPTTSPRDQFISICISESSLYDMQHTTQVLAHEISHFVGQDTRNRETRKRCMYHYCIHSYLLDVFFAVFLCTEEDETNVVSSELGQLLYELEREKVITGLAEQISGILMEDPEKFSLSSNVFSTDLANEEISQLSSTICNSPYLRGLVFEKIWDVFQKYIWQPKRAVLIAYWNDYATRHIKVDSDLAQSDKMRLLRLHMNHLMHQCMIKQAHLNSLGLEKETFISSNLSKTKEEYIVDLYRETFADIQAVCLLNMSAADYCSLLYYEHESTPRDNLQWKNYANIPVRVLAVSIAMIKSGQWDQIAVQAAFAKTQGFDSYRHLLTRDILASFVDYTKAKMNAFLMYYLVEYLCDCVDSITRMICDLHKSDHVDNLRSTAYMRIREVYASISKCGTVRDFETSLISFIEHFVSDVPQIYDEYMSISE